MAHEENFELMLSELEELVRRMEAGGLSLKEVLDMYEQGARLASSLTGELAAAQNRLLELSGGTVQIAEDVE